MKYENFEDVPVWQDAIDLSVRIFGVTEDPAFRGKAMSPIRFNGPVFPSRTTLPKALSGEQRPS